MIVGVVEIPSTKFSIVYDAPLIIHVNDPIIDPYISYVPTTANRDVSTTIPPVDTRKRRMTITETVGTYTVSTSTVSKKLDDYELSTGFIYDETNLTISVFDGNYNNLTNKPDATISLNDANSSNYTKRINTELTVALGDKLATLTSTSLATLLNTSTDFVINGAKIDLSQNTSNYVSRINTLLTTADTVLGVRVDNTSNYVSRINTTLTTTDTALGVRVDDTSNYVSRINTALTTADTALGVRVDNTSNYVSRINTTLTTEDTALGVRVDDTSNYVSRINNALTTADTASGVRVDNTSNYVSSTRNILVNRILASSFTPTSANLISVFNGTQFTNNVGTGKIDIITTWKPTTAGVADTALKLASSKNIAGVGFDGSTSIAIPYANLDFKITVGTGISITTGSATSSPIISATSSTPTSTSLIGIFNATQFTSNILTSKIDILDTWKPTTSITADRLTTSVNIGNVSFDGSTSIDVSYLKLTNRPWINPSFSVNNAYVYTTRFVKIGDTIEPVYPLDVIGDGNITGEFRKNGTIFSGGGGGVWTAGTGTLYTADLTGKVGIGTSNPLHR